MTIEFFFTNAWRWKEDVSYNLGLPQLETQDPTPWGTAPDIEEIRKLSFNNDFVKLMANRMILGFFRYGDRNKQKKPIVHINSVKRRIALYEETGNTECLIDAANILRMEFERPQHPNAHFYAQDDGEHSHNIK